jgi:hypothetical protein
MTTRRRGTPWVLLSIVFALSSTTLAEWNEDPAKNLAIADRVADQIQPKVAPTADGGAYLSWFDNAAGGYDLYLQRLDGHGNEVWAHNGILVADRSFSSTQDYGLDVDAGGNALLVFRDDRSGSTQITASKVASDGTLVWGTSGVQLTSGSAFFAAPDVAGTADGGSVVGWTRDADTVLQKLDDGGVPLWGSGIKLSDDSGGNFGLSDIEASDGVNVIVSWVRQGSNIFDPRHIWAQKFDGSGAELWASSHVRVYDGGSIQLGNFPTFVTDGAGGAVFRWYSTSPLQCFVQRILADGSEAFAHNGVPVSTDATHTRVSPDASFNPATREVYVFWTEMNSNQSQWGVYGQKIAPDGSRQWTDTGKVLRPIGATPFSQISLEPYPDGAMVIYAEELAVGNERLLATRVDAMGDPVGSPSTVTVSSVASGKSYLDTGLSSRRIALLAWSDDREGDRDVFGQNVNGDGSLGPACELYLDGTAPTLIEFPPSFHVAAGLLSDLRPSGGFSLAACAGDFPGSPGTDPLGDPAAGDGRYYLARGTARCTSYGDSSLAPDPRDDLDAADPCP